MVGLRTLNDSFNKFMAGDKESRKFLLRFFRKTIKMKFEGLCTLVSFCSLDYLKYQGFAINFDAAKHPRIGQKMSAADSFETMSNT